MIKLGPLVAKFNVIINEIVCNDFIDCGRFQCYNIVGFSSRLHMGLDNSYYLAPSPLGDLSANSHYIENIGFY